MNFSWGNAFSDNLIKGYNFGKAVRTDRSQREYADRTKAIDIEEAEDKEALDAVRQAKFDELNDPNGKYASWTPEQKKAEIAKMDSLRDQGYSDASRTSNVGRKQAMVDYYGAIGDIANADKSKTELRQAQWSQKFWDKVKQNPGAYDGDIAADLSSDTAAIIQKRQYLIDKNGDLVITENGKQLGQPIQITDQMRAPYLQQLYTTQYNREFGVAPTQQDATAWNTRKQAISTALKADREMRNKERSTAIDGKYKSGVLALRAKELALRDKIATATNDVEKKKLAIQLKDVRSKIAGRELDNEIKTAQLNQMKAMAQEAGFRFEDAKDLSGTQIVKDRTGREIGKYDPEADIIYQGNESRRALAVKEAEQLRDKGISMQFAPKLGANVYICNGTIYKDKGAALKQAAFISRQQKAEQTKSKENDNERSTISDADYKEIMDDYFGKGALGNSIAASRVRGFRFLNK